MRLLSEKTSDHFAPTRRTCYVVFMMKRVEPTIQKYISVDPAVCHGKPCFRGTRIMVHQVIELLAAGETPTEIIEHAYPSLTRRHVEAALQYAARTAEAGHISTLLPRHEVSVR